jgi:hypothetical protein
MIHPARGEVSLMWLFSQSDDTQILAVAIDATRNQAGRA